MKTKSFDISLILSEKYSPMVQKAIAKLADAEIRIVAATHGPIWRRDPGRIIDLYDRWSRQQGKPGVVVVYGSMYGHTERMMPAFADWRIRACVP